jgi:hypothetical protein
MNNKHLFRISLAVLLGFAALTGCKKDPIGSVSGTITVYNPLTPLVKTPLDSIKVYLVNMDFKADTVKPTNNRAALIDSANTDAAGKFSFTALPEGNYSVVPVPAKVLYRFLPDSPNGDPSFSVTTDGSATEINFTAPIPDSNNDESRFHITIKQINRPANAYLGFNRDIYITFFPNMLELPDLTMDDYLYEDEYGWTCIFYTLDDGWEIVTRKMVDGKYENIKWYYFGWNIGYMPHTATVTFDWATERLTVVDGQ